MSMRPISQNEEYLEEWRKTLENDIIQSPCTMFDIPEETILLRILRSLNDHAEIRPDQPAIIDAFDNRRSLTYKQILDGALSITSFLKSIDFSSGDRATAMIPNGIEWPLFHLGVWTAGGVIVGSSIAFKLHETIYQLHDSQSSVILTTEQLLPMIIEAVKECPAVRTIICVRSSSASLPEGIIDFEDALKFQPARNIVSVSLDSECLVYYSSGTTGQPKGVIHTHRSFHCAIEMWRSHWLHEVYPVLGVPNVEWLNESQIITSGCFHILGFGILNWFLITGSPIVIMPSFKGDFYLDVIAKYKPRFLFVAPPVFAFLTKDPAGQTAPLASVQLIMCSSAPLSQELSDEFFTHHPNVDYVVQGYGMTETAFSHLPLLLHKGANASGGVIAASYEQKIINPDTLLPCTRGQMGEVCVRGVVQSIGYLNKLDATKFLIDEDGWTRTGDVGYMDERGLLYIADRMKELIKVNYNNQTLQVPPAELEGILLSNGRVRDAAIVGIPDDARGALVRAFIVRADHDLSENEVESIVA
ncbi:hypothetical protein PFISCL1PPCAC_10843, partial [Pristionchus fissidentatus]